MRYVVRIAEFSESSNL